MNKSLGCIIEDLCDLLSKQGYSEGRINGFKTVARGLDSFLEEKGCIELDPAIMREYASALVQADARSALSAKTKDRLGIIDDLIVFYETGSYHYGRQPKAIAVKGLLEESAAAFLSWKNKQRKMAENTRRDYLRHLKDFSEFLSDRGVLSLGEIDAGTILDYVDVIGSLKDSRRPSRSAHLRIFLGYLCEQEDVSQGLDRLIPKMQGARQPRLPSIYSRDEIDMILGAIDRANPVGKRNYAMITVLARLGLRAHDVCYLRFSDIHWDRDCIEIVQYKTGRPVLLPLLTEVGDAIIGYLKQGRPVSDSPYVFLRAVAPYDYPLSSGGLSTLVRECMARAGIDCSKRHRGPHALRHSLAASLLENDVPLPTISGILGHESIESTGYYLRVDVEKMRCCCLDVPLVDPAFYRRWQR